MTAEKAEKAIEIRAYIKGRSILELTAKATYCASVCDLYGVCQILLIRGLVGWVASFCAGRQQLKRWCVSVRPRSFTTKVNMDKNQTNMYLEARCQIKRSRSKYLSYATFLWHEFISFLYIKYLKSRQTDVRRKPHVLSEDQKQARVKLAKQLLKMFPWVIRGLQV